ncbi:MAG: exo-beta-N-acetylmuramidase NamZ domain-containing protein, partial [Terriglobales bacterium]
DPHLLRRCGAPESTAGGGCVTRPEPDFQPLDSVLEEAVAMRHPPGAVVIVGHRGKMVYRKAFGFRALEPRPERMSLDTIFDVASLTKPMVTATSVMRLVELGQVRLNDPVAKYLPEFGTYGKEQITVRQLLTHYSGLPPDLPLNGISSQGLKPLSSVGRPPIQRGWQGKDAAFRLAMETIPVSPPGSRFLYSDINYVVLGFLVERVSGMPLDKYAEAHIFQVLEMKTTRFLPPPEWLPRIAPTEFDERGVMLRGVPHDPTARRMGGVAGHAGLFATADDVARFAQDMMGPSKILQPLTIEKMTTPQQPPNMTSVRGLGWDIDSPFSSPRGELLPAGSYGHTGFTGTSLWIDPVTQTYLVILTNGVHPRGGESLVSMRSRVATAVAAALGLNVSKDEELRLARITGYNETAVAARRVRVRNGAVKAGIDVLEARDFDVLRAATRTTQTVTRIGLVTNQTGLDSQGRRTIDVLAQAPGIELTAIFSPEHGVTGTLDTTEIGNTRDAATGVPVYSVYGATEASRRPSLDVLRGLDAVVYDMQDAGIRWYTYESTLGYFLEAAAKAGIEMVVLDRPNPVTGAYVQGPVSDAGRESFVNYFSVPVRHGMTVGELAKMFNSERHIGARLVVVPMQGWIRGDWFDSTGMTWVNPSPNLRSLTAAALYGGVAMVEGTNVSVGRGTDTPFEVVGAPWVEARDLAAYLNRRAIPGARFVPVKFTPASGIYAGQVCGGVNIIVLDRDQLDAPELGVELASALRAMYPGQYKMDRMMELLANQAVFNAIARGQDPRRIADDWREALERFEEVRKKYLIY